jgi:hypothetical protein
VVLKGGEYLNGNRHELAASDWELDFCVEVNQVRFTVDVFGLSKVFYA